MERRKRSSTKRQVQLDVLIVDDDHGVRNVLAPALATEGYFIYLADGTNVLEALTARDYDLIITDLKMSGVDGLETLAVAKKECPDAKLMVITGYPSEESLQLCRDLGVDRYLVKPFSVSEIRQVARNVLRGKRCQVR